LVLQKDKQIDKLMANLTGRKKEQNQINIISDEEGDNETNTIIPYFIIYYKALLIRAAMFQQNAGRIHQWNRTERSKVNQYVH
jgi:hypothetical protein